MRLVATAVVIATLATISIVHALKTETISGHARVVDGDTVVVGTTHVRLKGVDAPELMTERGENARRVMIRIVGSGPLTCTLTGERTWGRQVGYCFTADGVDINRAIIESGAALACPHYSTKYVQYEQAAAIKAQERAKYCLNVPAGRWWQ